MDGLIKRVRSRRSGKEELGSTSEARTPPQKSPSFRERKPQRWFRRQLSGRMNFNESSEEAEYAAAVAAATFAITSLEPADVADDYQRKPQADRQPSLTKIRSKLAEAFAAMTESREASKTSADEHKAKDSERYESLETSNPEPNMTVPEKTIHPVPSIKRTPTMPKKRLTFADDLQQEDTAIRKTPSFGEEQLEDAKRMKPTAKPSFERIPSVKKAPTPSFGDERFEDGKRVKQGSGAPPILPSPIPPPPIPPLNIQPPVPPKRARGSRGQETDADAWEREELAKIKARYEKLNATILEWEDKKKKKAKRKLETTESDLEKRRAKAMQNYQIEMERIKQIADGARAQAKDKQRNEELKVKEKALRYRATGELPQPPVCLCL